MSKLKPMLVRQSGLPIVVEHMHEYSEAFRAEYDHLLGKYNSTSFDDMNKFRDELDIVEKKLLEKYPLQERVEMPKNQKQWQSLIERVQAPILVARSLDNSDQIVLVIMDQAQSEQS